MNLTKLGSVAIRLAQRNVLFQRQAIHPRAGILHRCRGSLSSEPNDDDDDLDKPIKFSSSEAAAWNAVYSRTGGPISDAPWYQGHVIIASTLAFLVYFLILREENDIDQKLTGNLGDHFYGEQQENLQASLRVPEELKRATSS